MQLQPYSATEDETNSFVFFLQCLVLKQAAAAILENRGHKSIVVECYDEDFTFCECFSISPFDDQLQVSGVSLLE